MSYVGTGQGEYIQETTYKYVGCGGDFDTVRPRRDFTCIITGCCLSALLLIPLLLYLLGVFSTSTSLAFDCLAGNQVEWPDMKVLECCQLDPELEICEPDRVVTTPTVPPTPFPTPLPTPFPTPFPTPRPTPPPTPPPTPVTTQGPVGPVDPYNCAVGAESSWDAGKKAWCCRVHNKGCPTLAPTLPPPTAPPVVPTAPPPPADPYNCADGYANWQAGWSVGKKAWCCRVHGKGCPNSPGCGTTSAPYDCAAGFSNWMAGWSVAKKQWCCQHTGKGCPPAAGGCA
jgi:hypothetical protein